MEIGLILSILYNIFIVIKINFFLFTDNASLLFIVLNISKLQRKEVKLINFVGSKYDGIFL